MNQQVAYRPEFLACLKFAVVSVETEGNHDFSLFWAPHQDPRPLIFLGLRQQDVPEQTPSPNVRRLRLFSALDLVGSAKQLHVRVLWYQLQRVFD
jgi:hypothetical protein